MGLIDGVLSDVGDIVGTVGDTVGDAVELDIPEVLSDVGDVVTEAVDAVTNVVTNLGKILAGAATTSPTTEPTTSQPPTTQPPTTQPPTTQPPTTQPPTTQPPTTKPPTTQPENPTTTSSSSNNNPLPPQVPPPAGVPTEGNSDPNDSDTDGDGATTGPPSATGTVRPNPVALPHDPDGEDDTSNGNPPNSGTGNGNGNGNSNSDGPNGTIGGPGTLDGGNDKSGLSKGGIAAIAIVAVLLALLALVCLLRCWFIRRRRAKRNQWAQRPTATTIADHTSWAGGPVAVTPRQSSDSSQESHESFFSGSTHESKLFTGPIPSWCTASATQQRRMQTHGDHSSSAENFGTILENGPYSWTAAGAFRGPATGVTVPPSAYILRHDNGHIIDDTNSITTPVSASGPSMHPSRSEVSHISEADLSRGSLSGESFTASSDMHESGLAYSRSPSPQDMPARSSTHLSGQFMQMPSTMTFGPVFGSQVMTQVASAAPIAVPAHLIVPSQMAYSPTPAPAPAPFVRPVSILTPIVVPPVQARVVSPPPSSRTISTPSPLWIAPSAWGSPAPTASTPPPPRSPILPIQQSYPKPPPPPRTTSGLFMEDDPFASPLDFADRV